MHISSWFERFVFVKVLLIVFSAFWILPLILDAGTDEKTHSDALIVLEDATQVKYTKSGSCDQVNYSLKREYPAQDVIDAISSRLSERGWEPLKESWMNPGLENSHVRGWGNFGDATTDPHSTVFQWSADWQNSKGDMVSYFLQYRDPEEILFPKKPKTDELSVFASYSPEAVVKETKKWIEENKDKWNTSEGFILSTPYMEEDPIRLWATRSESQVLTIRFQKKRREQFRSGHQKSKIHHCLSRRLLKLHEMLL